jgi:hypothetical protein
MAEICCLHLLFMIYYGGMVFESMATHEQITSLYMICIEGPEKTTRGGEWEPIKIPHRNFTYITNQTQRASLLT